MMLPNTTAARLALWTAAAGIVLGALVAAAVATCRLHRRATWAGGLASDPAAVHYRYAIQPPAIAPDAAGAIAALEARVQEMASPFDLAELADLYLRKAQQDGDPADYKAADAMARRSLALLPDPNPAVLTLARLADARHEFREAIELARRSRARSAGAQIILATAHLALGELSAAAEAADAAIALKPDSAGHLMRALVMQA
ncbi:MAG TPA: hypothetical protein VFT22_33265, partial [Kofleriaceae bacterium]|nr:hypothetical protein [Kofleriaceae bacterium]